MGAENLEKMLKFLKSEEVIYDYLVDGNEITIVKFIDTEEEDIFRIYSFTDGVFNNRKKLIIETYDSKTWD